MNDKEKKFEEKLEAIYKGLMQRLGIPPVPDDTVTLDTLVKVICMKKICMETGIAYGLLGVAKTVEILRALADAMELGQQEQERMDKGL